MTDITISIDDELMDAVKKRAKKQYQDVKQLITNIVRRSMLSYKKGGKTTYKIKVDDKLVSIFSRHKTGPKKKKTTKKKAKKKTKTKKK